MTPLEDSFLHLLPSQKHKNLSEGTIQALNFLVSTSTLLIQFPYSSSPLNH